jgi:outer membrane protein OmpA-like peptidoglycan-associated protein
MGCAGLCCAAVLLLLSGCGPTHSYNPVDWWHDLEGGPISDSRPPPPNADAPYPNLASVPAKPNVPDAAARARIASGLVADRANAQYAASLSPLPAPSTAASRPLPRPPAAAVSDDTSSATLQAANAPPAPPAGLVRQGPPQPPLPNVPMTAPRPAPITGVKAAPLAAPPPPVAAASVAAAPVAGGDASAAAVLPDMPDRPPAAPRLPGVLATTAPTPPPATPPTPSPVPVAGTGGPVVVGFPAGSADLPQAAVAPLKDLAQKRGGSSIAVTGYGEAASSEPAAQSAALPLALARARAIAAGLQAAGVPASAIRLTAEAAGDGGAARLVSN